MNQGGIWQNGGSGLNRCCKKMTPKSGSVFRRWVGQNMTGVNTYFKENIAKVMCSTRE